MEILKEISVGPRPTSIAFHLKENFAYVSNLGSNYISIIDLGSYSNMGKIEVGKGPDGITIIPYNQGEY
jgi:YVTN family beta-propeller protein